MFVFIKSESSLWTVGHYDPAGKWEPESDHSTSEEAAERVRQLNGGAAMLEALSKREHFAGLVLQGLIASGAARSYAKHEYAEQAVAYADALLDALAQKPA